MGSQSTEQLIRDCTILNNHRDTIKKGITDARGRWPLSNSERANNLFQKFVNLILRAYEGTKGTKRTGNFNPLPTELTP
jgi:hypothetical protein